MANTSPPVLGLPVVDQPAITAWPITTLPVAPLSIHTPMLKAALFGDSITAINYVANTGYGSEGSFNWANALLGWPFSSIVNLGVGGNTTADMLRRLPLLIGSGAGVAFVRGGTNDIYSAPVNIDPAAIFANLLLIYRAVLEAKMLLVVYTVPVRNPSGIAASQLLCHSQLNRLIRDYAQTTPGVLLVDEYAVGVNGSDATGAPKANYLYDSATHPANICAFQTGKLTAAVLGPFVPRVDRLVASAADNSVARPGCSNILDSGLMLGTGGSSGTGGSGTVPTGWTASRTSGASGTSVAVSTAARSDGYGNDVLMTVTGDAAETTGVVELVTPSLHSRVSAGEFIKARAAVKLDSAPAGIKGMYLRLSVTAGGTTVTRFSMIAQFTDQPMEEGFSGVFETEAIQVPAGSVTALTLHLRVRCGASAAGVVRWGRVSLEKVSG